jgi:Na+-driven multidrug efflux pump
MIIADNQNMLKTFFQYSIPCIAGMFLTSFITVIDGMFIAWGLGEQGLAAVNLTLPVLYILLALTIMLQIKPKLQKRTAQHFWDRPGRPP